MCAGVGGGQLRDYQLGNTMFAVDVAVAESSWIHSNSHQDNQKLSRTSQDSFQGEDSHCNFDRGRIEMSVIEFL